MSTVASSAAFTERLADWAGPLVVKEIRSGLKSRAFAVAFGLLLLSGFSVLAANAVLTEGVEPRGKFAAAGAFTAYAVFGHLLVPFFTFRSMVKEREEETWVLLVLTGLGTPGIVRGKSLSAVAQLALGLSAMGPFLLMSYLLSGVDLPTLLLCVALHVGTSVLLSHAALGIAAQSESRIERTVGHIIVLVVCCALSFLALVVSYGFISSSSSPNDEIVCLFVGIATMMVLTSTAIVPAAAAALALETETNPHPARVRLIIAVGLCLVVTCIAVAKGARGDTATLVSALASLVLLFAGFVALSERPGYPNARWADGVRRPGALRSGLVVFGLLFAVAIVCGGVTAFSRSSTFGAALAAPAYVASYLSVGFFFGRHTPLARFGPRMGARSGILIASIGAPVVLSAFAVATGEQPAQGPAWMFNPIFGLMRLTSRGTHTEAFALAALALFAMISVASMLAAEDVRREREHG